MSDEDDADGDDLRQRVADHSASIEGTDGWSPVSEL